MRRYSCIMIMLALVFCHQAPAQDIRIPADALAVLSINDVDVFRAKTRKLPLSAIFEDEGWQSFLDKFRDLRLQDKNDNGWSKGFRSKTLLDACDGPLSIFLIGSKKNRPAICVAMRLKENATAEAAIGPLLNSYAGPPPTTEAFSGVRLKIYSGTQTGRARNFTYTTRKRLLVFSSETHAVKSYLAALSAGKDGNQNKNLLPPEIKNNVDFWFAIDPFRTSRSMRPFRKQPPETKTLLDIAENEGFDAIDSLSGTGHCSNTGEAIHLDLTIAARRPFKRSMRLLNLQNRKPTAVPPWISNSTSRFGTIWLDYPNSLESFATLFDTLLGEGEEGVFELVLDDLKNDPQGPQVDIRKELVTQLSPGLTFGIEGYGNKAKSIFGTTVADPEELTKTISKLYNGDESAEKVQKNGMVAWIVRPIENDPAGGGPKKPYVIAIKDKHVLIGPSVEHIEQAFGSQSESHDGQWFKECLERARSQLNSQTCFDYYGHTGSFIQWQIEQIRSGQLDGNLGTLFDTMGWSHTFRKIDPSKIPSPEKSQTLNGGRLAVSAATTDAGFRVIVHLAF